MMLYVLLYVGPILSCMPGRWLPGIKLLHRSHPHFEKPLHCHRGRSGPLILADMTQQSVPALVLAGDFSSAVKVLDGAIDETRQDYAAALHRLVQLHLNRGLCNQKLHLNRKALKVCASTSGDLAERELVQYRSGAARSSSSNSLRSILVVPAP